MRLSSPRNAAAITGKTTLFKGSGNRVISPWEKH
jgi:hypothetical protein